MHTLKITVFVFIVSLLLGLAIALLGRERIDSLLMTDSAFQPFLTALIGLIPNCAASVVLTDLYAAGSLSFGSVVAGLSTGAGLGLAVLFRTNRNISENLTVTAILYLTGSLAGVVLNLV